MTSTEATGLFGLLILGSTIGVVAVDKSLRAKRRLVAQPDDAIMLREDPGWVVVIAFAVLLNAFALPYWFASTRRGLVGLLIGVVAAAICIGGSIGVMSALGVRFV